MGIGRLARSASVSVQHCRDLEAWGVLPPAHRTPGGHRRFDEIHVLALRTYEVVARGYNAGRARELMVLANAGSVDAVLELVDERHATLHRQRDDTRRVLDLLDRPLADLPARAPAVLPIGATATTIGVTPSTLRHWEAEQLVTPGRDPHNGYRRYGRGDLRALLVVRMLREAGYPIEQVRGVVAQLDQAHPDRAIELAERRLRELADASRAAVASDTALWAYVAVHGDQEVRPVGVHLLYG
jgi:DNA-binding transcriptional MerR regulator